MVRRPVLSSSRKSVYSLITIIGLGYFVAFATVQIVADWLSGTIPFFDFYHVPFIILFTVSILLVWARPRIGYLVSMIVGLVAVAIFTPFTFVKGLSSPADVGLFVYVMTVFPLILAAVSYSVMGRLVLRKSERSNSFRFSILRRTIAVLVLGFIVGGFTVGALAAGTENQLLASAGTSADITIPRGAGTLGNAGYIPGNFTTTVGKTVTWANKDTTTHTVTSMTGLFDSGILNPGQTFSHTFNQAGVYSYYCTLHSWMKGNVTVKP
jgi:plastocyanin